MLSIQNWIVLPFRWEPHFVRVWTTASSSIWLMWRFSSFFDHSPWRVIPSANAPHPKSDASVVMWMSGFGGTVGTPFSRFVFSDHHARSSRASSGSFTHC